MSRLAIENKLLEYKEELANVKGTATECYSRIVGYYRPVKQWNKGKAQEYNERKEFDYATSN